MNAFRSLRGRDLVRCVLIPLVLSWLIAGAFGLLIARIQYTEVASAFPPDRVATEYQSRIDRELLHGLLLFMPQVSALSALLVWQIGVNSRRASNLTTYGAALGAIFALVEILAMWAFEVPILYVLCVAAIMIAVGWFAGWLYESRDATQP